MPVSGHFFNTISAIKFQLFKKKLFLFVSVLIKNLPLNHIKKRSRISLTQDLSPSFLQPPHVTAWGFGLDPRTSH